MKGVSSTTRNGNTYWYARVDGQKKYMGKIDEGKELAIAARSKYVAKQYENRQIGAGLKVKKIAFKTVREMLNWYMEIPRIQRQKSYGRKVDACVHLLNYFGSKPVHGIESDDIERYREKRNAAPNTINLEIRVLSAAFNEARRAKKFQADMLPGAFPLEHDYNPRPIITEEQFFVLLKEVKNDFADLWTGGYENPLCGALR